MVQATAKDGTILSSFCWSAASIMLVISQLLIMYMIMYEGVDQSCYDHTHCQVGMMCTAGGMTMAFLGTAVSHEFENLHAKKKKWAFWVFDCVATPLFCLLAAELVMALAKFIFV